MSVGTPIQYFTDELATLCLTKRSKLWLSVPLISNKLPRLLSRRPFRATDSAKEHRQGYAIMFSVYTLLGACGGS